MQLTIHDNWWEGIKDLPQERQDLFLGAMARYFFADAEEPEFSGIEAAVWGVLKKLIDDSKKGQINGAKGGNGRGNTRGKAGETLTNKGTKKPPTKTPQENPPFKKKEKKEERVFSNHKKTLSLSQDGAGAEKAAPSSDEIAAIFAEVDARFQEPKNMGEYLQEFGEAAQEEHPGSVPCPPDVRARAIEAVSA